MIPDDEEQPWKPEEKREAIRRTILSLQIVLPLALTLVLLMYVATWRIGYIPLSTPVTSSTVSEAFEKSAAPAPARAILQERDAALFRIHRWAREARANGKIVPPRIAFTVVVAGDASIQSLVQDTPSGLHHIDSAARAFAANFGYSPRPHDGTRTIRITINLAEDTANRATLDMTRIP